jgi:uncharacterized membrane protein
MPPRPVLRRLAAVALVMLCFLAAVGLADWAWIESGFFIVALWLGSTAFFGAAAAIMITRAARRDREGP